ncbi:hypothetical protein [Lacticaseibacillus paracasei]|uniref:hypothetical protein n=1 Tax=Lacticaseibacillus paracasei TaxID=1597 RepID=UPI00124B59A3|nr:hypothetical protein [Lacticaseibacillus paracasei]KAB1967825.1 hypothetical protein F8272_02500 [Lacticaseibacillus paracasei]MCT3333067.1 hypothetical protein [Lacticaseibacillus paracasei]WPP11648.1 hypothetical protein SGY26_00520 [Lacticaseibacillus paracasei]WQG48214.1 hypothetical protein U2Q69_05520 [Lacticaseibacillus casei]
MTNIEKIWLIVLLIVAFVVPIFGLIPAVYLFTKRRSTLYFIALNGWITGAIVLQIFYLISVIVIGWIVSLH